MWRSANPRDSQARAARGAIPHDTSLGLFDEGVVGTAAFRLRALAKKSGARSRGGLRHGLLVALLLGASACTSKPESPPVREDGPKPSPDEPKPTTADGPKPPTTIDEPSEAVGSSDWDVVRIDPASHEQTNLGRVRIDDGPPFHAAFVDGSDELRALVEQANALGDFTYHDGSPVIRASDPRWFDFLRREWVAGKHGLVLRVASESAAVSRWQLMVVDDGEQVSLGMVEINDMGYLRVIDGPPERREQLVRLIDQVNERDSESIEIPPPDGERGQWAKALNRGTPEFFAMMRHSLYGHDALLIAAARAQSQPVSVLESRELRVRVPAGLTATEVEYPTIVSLSGPPGGPLGLLVVEYDGIPDEDAALLSKVESLYGHDPQFEPGPAIEVELGGQRWRAATCRTGAEQARATHLIVLWSPSLDRIRGGQRSDDGYILALTLGGEREAQQLLDHPLLATVVDSLP